MSEVGHLNKSGQRFPECRRSLPRQIKANSTVTVTESEKNNTSDMAEVETEPTRKENFNDGDPGDYRHAGKGIETDTDMSDSADGTLTDEESEDTSVQPKETAPPQNKPPAQSDKTQLPSKKLTNINPDMSDESFLIKTFREMYLNFKSKIVVVSVLVIFVVLSPFFSSYSAQLETCDLEEIREKFPSQEQDLWLAFESGVRDVVTLGRPSSFILLYQEDTEATLVDLVDELAKYASCNITDCSKQPIITTDTILNTPEFINDYGKIIIAYRDELQEKGVMIIKNLENVQGVPAQAFHSFCDEFTPLVDKSLFIFTMKVEKFPENSMEFVEQYFKNKWTDIKIDALNALITRITSMVIKVWPE